MGKTEPIPLMNGGLEHGGEDAKEEMWKNVSPCFLQDGNESGSCFLILKPPGSNLKPSLVFSKSSVFKCQQKPKGDQSSPTSLLIAERLKFRVPCSLIKGKMILVYGNHSTLHLKKQKTKMCEQGSVWHHFINLQTSVEKYNHFHVPFSSWEFWLVCVCIHTYTHTHFCFVLLVRWFWSAARDQYRIGVNQIKENRRPSSFQMVILSDCLNIKFILICNPK